MNKTEQLTQCLENLPGKRISVQLRTLLPVINLKLKAGVSHEEIVEALQSQGFSIKLNTFRTYLYRHRKKIGAAIMLPLSAKPHQAPTSNAPTIHNKQDLMRLHNQDIDLSAYAKIAKQNKGEKK